MKKINELEKKANATHMKLRRSNEALILKEEVPIMYTATGLVAKDGTVDYHGCLKGGRYICFDAKETESKTSFPLNNIKEHQLNFLNLIESLEGIAFFMIHFKNVHPDKVYITPLELINKYWDPEERNSIPLKDFKDEWLTTVEDYPEKVEELYVK